MDPELMTKKITEMEDQMKNPLNLICTGLWLAGKIAASAAHKGIRRLVDHCDKVYSERQQSA